MTTPRRSPYIDQAVTAALRDVNVIDAALVGLAFARDTVTTHGRTDRDTARAEASAMFADLYRRRGDALMRAMQFGALTANDDLRRDAFKAAAGYLAKQNQAIMQYLEIDGVTPGSWATDVQEEFRAEIVAAVAALNEPTAGS